MKAKKRAAFLFLLILTIIPLHARHSPIVTQAIARSRKASQQKLVALKTKDKKIPRYNFARIQDATQKQLSHTHSGHPLSNHSGRTGVIKTLAQASPKSIPQGVSRNRRQATARKAPRRRTAPRKRTSRRRHSVSRRRTAPRRRAPQQKNDFSQCYSLFITNKKKNIPGLAITNTRHNKFLIWSKKTERPFTELIVSWNASRPRKGKYQIFVNVKHERWSGWKRLAEWGTTTQRTFSDTRNRFFHVKHVRAETQRGRTANEYKIKIIARNGADINGIKAVFANVANWNKFRVQTPMKRMQHTYLNTVPKHSQWWLKHERTKDLCSPTSTSIIVRYFNQKRALNLGSLNEEASRFAPLVQDSSLDIFGCWPLNVAQAFDSSGGKVFFHVERLNNFESLYTHLRKGRPIAVSIRGRLRGGAWPYNNGHFVVVVGWNNKRNTVICIDPAFRKKAEIVRNYPIKDFMTAWGKSRNLSYVPEL